MRWQEISSLVIQRTTATFSTLTSRVEATLVTSRTSRAVQSTYTETTIPSLSRMSTATSILSKETSPLRSITLGNLNRIAINLHRASLNQSSQLSQSMVAILPITTKATAHIHLPTRLSQITTPRISIRTSKINGEPFQIRTLPSEAASQHRHSRCSRYSLIMSSTIVSSHPFKISELQSISVNQQTRLISYYHEK